MSSIAQANRLKEVEARLEELAYQIAAIEKTLNDAVKYPETMAQAIASVHARIDALKNDRPKPGRPPKNG